MFSSRSWFLVSFVLLLACTATRPPPPPQKNLPPCGEAAKPECNGTCPYPGQTCYLRPGFPSCACY